MKSKKAKILLDQLETTYMGGFTAYDKEDVIKIVETSEKELIKNLKVELEKKLKELGKTIDDEYRKYTTDNYYASEKIEEFIKSYKK